MMRPLKQNSYCSSQKSPNIVLTEPPTKDLGSYFNMFLQDFCCYTVFQTANHDSELFSVSSQELRRLLCYRDSSFLHYGFVQHINEVVATLIKHGRAFIEVITEKDESSNLVGISFRLIQNRSARRVGSCIQFRSSTFGNTSTTFWIPESSLIILNLKNLSFSRGYFVRLFRKIQKIELPLNMMGIKNFDITKYSAIADKKMLRLNKRTFWYGRNSSNQYLSEAYLLYHVMNFRMLQWKFLEYVIVSYNKALSKIEEQVGPLGQINIDPKRPDYGLYWDQLQKGELNFEQFGNHLYRV